MKTKIKKELLAANAAADEAYEIMRKTKKGTLSYNLAHDDFVLNCGKAQALERVLQMM